MNRPIDLAILVLLSEHEPLYQALSDIHAGLLDVNISEVLESLGIMYRAGYVEKHDTSAISWRWRITHKGSLFIRRAVVTAAEEYLKRKGA